VNGTPELRELLPSSPAPGPVGGLDDLGALAQRVPGLDADQRLVLVQILHRPRAVAELRAGLAWPRRRVLDALAALERQHWIVLEVRTLKADDRVFAVVPDLLPRLPVG